MDALARKLIKIKRDGDEWRFTWSQGSRIFTMKDNERPRPGLPAALDGLVGAAIEAVAFIDKKYHGKVRVSGVDFDWKGDDERRNGVINLFVDNGAQGLSPVSTPKKLADNELKEAKKPRWDKEAVNVMNKLQEEALAYIDGERSQQAMPLMGGKNKKGKKEDGKDSQGSLDTGE